ncbi:MAG: TetR/AcrR family transcriptional regulator [Actinomycetota bacterium]|nr:TetR/AcrR family transcriptional regulator [Actinomycetota bacterium]
MAQRQRLRRQPRAQTRQDLLDAAARVIARRGLHGASVEAVSEEAGFSTGAVYSNFASKEAMFLALYEERIERRRRELREAVERAGGRAAGLAAAAGNASASLGRERDWFLLYFEFALHAARNPAFARRFKAVREEGLAELAEGLTEGLEHAGIDPPIAARDLARAIRAVSYGLALEGLVDDGEEPEALLGQVLELVFRGMRPEKRA